MTKLEFLDALQARLASLPENEVYRLLGYYAEMIDDRVESGMSEEEAVEALGSMDSIIESIINDMSIPKLMRARVKESSHRVGNKVLWIILVILTFPFWFPAVMACFGAVFSVFMAIWGVIIGLFVAIGALAVSGVGCIIGGLFFLFTKPLPVALFALGVGCILSGVTIFMIKPIKHIAKWLGKGISSLVRKIKALLFKKRRVNSEAK